MPTECAQSYTYERLADPGSGEVYAVQLTHDGRIVAAAGPLHYEDPTDPYSLYGWISNAGPDAREDGAWLANRFAAPARAAKFPTPPCHKHAGDAS